MGTEQSMLKELILLVGPPGSGKSSYAMHPARGFGTTYVNQDAQGKEGHLKHFQSALTNNFPFILVDRMNFSKEQRNRYLLPAKEAGYRTKIVVLHESFETCFKRCLERKNHETIKTEKDARNALGFFFKKYERVEDNEADEVVRIWPEGNKPLAIICDLDGTLAKIDHRLHFVRGEGKKDWPAFFNSIPGDEINEWCQDIINRTDYDIVLCSGRPDSHRKQTEAWLEEYCVVYSHLFMRSRDDFRQDDLVKEMIYEFEIKSRYEVYFWIDDRKQVVDKIRSHGITVLQCAEGNF
jgi:hypothetical protein